LQRSAKADARTLLRRASYALLGLPPSPADVAALAADPSPDAFAHAVDRVLASPHFGVHLGRAWLDLARYSDSNGLDENLAFGQAYRYRDWVVRALNADLPYDQFAAMQIAGDLLPAKTEQDRIDGLVATGFLAMGPKMLAEQDKEKLVLDTVDEQIDLVGRTFLGLTLGCARCHDHKFDPIPTRDYYALAGIFKSSSVFENLDHVSRWVERPLATEAQVKERAARQKEAEEAENALKARKTALMTEQPKRLVGQIGKLLVAGHALARHAIAQEAEAATATSLARDDAHWGSKDCVILHTGKGGPQFADYAVEVPSDGTYRLDIRMASQEARPLRIRIDGAEGIAKCCEATTGDWFPAHQRWITAGELRLAKGPHTLRIEGLEASIPHLDKWLLTPAGTAPLPADLPLALVRRAMLLQLDPSSPLGQQFAAMNGTPAARATAFGDLTAPNSIDELAARWQMQLTLVWQAWSELLDDAKQQKRETPKSLPLPSLERYRQLLLGGGGLLDLSEAEWIESLPAEESAALAALTTARDQKKAAVPPAPPNAMCMREDKPVDLPVHIRGNHLTLAKEAVPRGFLSVLAPLAPFPTIAAGQSGRLELTQWLFDPRNPLPARVAANRAWLQCFGHGLVDSPSNFGVRGEAPSHPELLDELALSLQHDGWSQKRLLRRILLSDTWQQQSLSDEDRALHDPGNRYLWRQHRRRLPAESIRDAILLTTESLDPTIGGTLLSTGDRDYVTNDQSGNAARYDAPRRSIYLPIIRNAMYDMFVAFDYVDPSCHLEKRPETAIAPQALLLMNSPFVTKQSEALAKLALANASDEAGRIEFVWQRALQRAPRHDEATAALAYLQSAQQQQGKDSAPDAGWQSLCQAVLCTNEFVYVD
jgi:hypothetical protein